MPAHEWQDLYVGDSRLVRVEDGMILAHVKERRDDWGTSVNSHTFITRAYAKDYVEHSLGVTTEE